MTDTYIQDKTFDKDDLALNPLAKGEYENCMFNGCNFANADLSGFQFTDCSFQNCNLSLAKLSRTAFRDVTFNNCKMLGLRFDTCNEFALAFSFDGCQLNHSSFYKTKIKKTVFKHSQLEGTDFTDADLTNTIFEHCDLAQALFEQTILEKVDFRSSYNYAIDPERNRIKQAKFSLMGISGLLGKYDIEIEQ